MSCSIEDALTRLESIIIDPDDELVECDRERLLRICRLLREGSVEIAHAEAASLSGILSDYNIEREVRRLVCAVRLA